MGGDESLRPFFLNSRSPITRMVQTLIAQVAASIREWMDHEWIDHRSRTVPSPEKSSLQGPAVSAPLARSPLKARPQRAPRTSYLCFPPVAPAIPSLIRPILMLAHRHCRLLPGLALLFSFGCQSPRLHRISENTVLFKSLDSFSQELIQNGLVNHGFSSAMVYMALGKPNLTSSVETPQGTVETWVYRNYLYTQDNASKLTLNHPGLKAQPGPMLSSSAPGGPSLTSTKTSPLQPTLSDIGDTPLGKLYVDLIADRVVKVRLEP